MATFSRFADLPTELRVLIWEAAMPRSPSVHFLSYPRRADVAADNIRGRRPNRWHSEIPDAQHRITFTDPELGEPNTRTGSFHRYSSYMETLSFLHACQESRHVCLGHFDSSSTVTLGPCASIPIDLDQDIICIQDPAERLPWTGPPRLRLSPELSPFRIAFERQPHTDCNFYIDFQRNPCDCVVNWIAVAPKFRSDKCFVETLGFQYMKDRQMVIYLLDYNIKPVYTIAPDGIGTDVQGDRYSCGSEQHGAGSSAVKSPVQTSKHNGKFHGHGATFYALAATNETYFEWDIPLDAEYFRDSFCDHLFEIYDYGAVPDSCKVTKRGKDIAVEFLACIRD